MGQVWCYNGLYVPVSIYTGKADSTENEGLGHNVVMSICQDLPRNTLVAFDNFFTSCSLMEDLFDKGIYAVRTVRSDRKYFPNIMKKTQPKNLRLDKHQYASMTSESITALKWHDTRDVTVLTTAHKPLDTLFLKITQKDGSRIDILCPTAIAEYTVNMTHTRGADFSAPKNCKRDQKYVTLCVNWLYVPSQVSDFFTLRRKLKQNNYLLFIINQTLNLLWTRLYFIYLL